MSDAPASLVQRASAAVGPDIFFAALTSAEEAALAYEWPLWARPSQLAPPGNWRTWVILAGRGFGKTRAGAEWVRHRIDAGEARHVALVGRTPADARDVMIEGPSGLLAIAPPHQRPTYEPANRRVTFHTGATATVFSSENPDQLRGPQHDTAWCDELASFPNHESWDNLQFGLRIGDPRQIVTTTPRPTRIIEELVTSTHAVVTTGSTYDNRANLAPAFLDHILERYEGTSLGKQELHGEILSEVDGAMWTRKLIDRGRIPKSARPPLTDFDRIVVAVDPSGSSTGDEVGIIVAGRIDRDLYILEDGSGQLSPQGWATRAIDLFREWHANTVIAEVNFGGDMVERTLRTVDGGATIPFRKLHASRGKDIRAEPVVARYEQARIHHVGAFGTLERQMCTWTSDVKDWSPDRMDALVWACRELADRQPYMWGGASA